MDIIKSIIEILKNSSEPMPIIYKDLAQPGVSNLGKAIGTVLNTVQYAYKVNT